MYVIYYNNILVFHILIIPLYIVFFCLPSRICLVAAYIMIMANTIKNSNMIIQLIQDRPVSPGLFGSNITKNHSIIRAIHIITAFKQRIIVQALLYILRAFSSVTIVR